MKQWTLAMHNFHDANKFLPAAHQKLAPNQDDNRFSANCVLLPFMEETARFTALQAVSAPYHSGFPIVGELLSVVLCPSDTSRKKTVNGYNTEFARGNIVTSLGDGSNNLSSDCTGSSTGDISSRGLFYWTAFKTLQRVTDGTSNTIAISETVCGTNDNKILGGIAILPSIDESSWWWNPNTCMSIKNGSTLSATVYNNTTRIRAGRYVDGLHLYTGFNTIMPPNSPSCIRFDSETSEGLYPPNSYHPGGVNCGLVDGSVIFVTDSVDTNGLPRHQQGNYLKGPSPFGIWGAMGTPSGGESLRL
jgi:prepilin-type processing-associated H-X9-DG protein